MVKKNKSEVTIDEEKSSIIGLGFAGSYCSANTSVVDTKNGKIVRIRPLHFDWKYDKKQFNPWKMEAHGKTFEPRFRSLVPPYSLAYKKRVLSPNRILYPLKRVDWDPGGERNPQNRGSSGYIRISWDEALEIIVSEIKRIHETYGKYAVLSQAIGHGESKSIHASHGCTSKLLELMGEYTSEIKNPDSWEGWYWGAKHAWGMANEGTMEPSTNVIPDVAQHTTLLLFWGCDPETTPWGFDGQMASRLCYWYTELGIKQVYICPDLNYGAAIHADKWIPIRPGTDAALQLAIAYIWITEGAYDKEYIKTHTIGFEKFEDYILGKEDGIPKTPGWASSKCAIPEWTIKALAREWGTKITSTAHGNGGPGIRSAYSTENGRLEVLLLAMQGLGKPGVHQVKMIEWGLPVPEERNPMPKGVVKPMLNALRSIQKGTSSDSSDSLEKKDSPEKPMGPMGLGQKQFIPKSLIHDALLKPSISWYGIRMEPTAPFEGQFIKHKYPVDGLPEVHMIWTDTPCTITCWNDSNSYIKALRSPKIEFMLAQQPWLENDCLLADIILPVCTKFELEDIDTDDAGGQFHILLRQRQCIKPLGESKSDYEIVSMIAEKLGLLEQFTGGKSVEELIKFGFNNSGIQGMTNYAEFEEKEYFVVPTDPDWNKYPAGLYKFYEDPDNNRMPLTPSGKIEFYAQGLAEYFPDDEERPPVPHWIEKGEGHNERVSSQRAKKYPLLQVSNHPHWRVHAQCDDITWTREAPTCKVKGADGYMYEPLWMNPSDAAARGIEDGDIVKIYNERGAVLAGAYVNERIMSGAVSMDHGSRYDPIIPGELDRGGAINTITPHNTTSKNTTGFVVSSFLVQVEKVTLAQLEAWKNKYPNAFEREYHPASGLRFDAWVE